MRIRDETARDIAAIGALVSEAFLSAPHASGTEARIVEMLRDDRALMLSLVAEEAGEVIGHLAASAACIGEAAGWALIGPLAVLPARQREGVGSALMAEALRRLRPVAPGAVLVGDPGYYRRFGFGARLGVTLPGVPSEFVLVLPFGCTAPPGVLDCHPAFALDLGEAGHHQTVTLPR